MHFSHREFIEHGHGKYGPWFDLVNSQEWDTYGNLTEHFENPAWLPFFLRHWGFAAPKGQPFPASQWAKFRAALRSICEAAAQYQRIRKANLHALNQAMKVSGTCRLRESRNGFHLEFVPAAYGWPTILAETARSFSEILANGDVSRIKICRNPGCRWVFFDETKGKTRCWCNDKICGNRARVRKARARNGSQPTL